MFWVEHAFHPILTAVSSSLFKRGCKITLDGGLEDLRRQPKAKLRADRLIRPTRGIPIRQRTDAYGVKTSLVLVPPSRISEIVVFPPSSE